MFVVSDTRLCATMSPVPDSPCLPSRAPLPCAVIEWEEWGNPQEKEFYECMKGYSPVDNLRAAAYPNMLVLAGLHDPRVGEQALLQGCGVTMLTCRQRWRVALRAAPVLARSPGPFFTPRSGIPACCNAGYWEPAKYVAKLRELRTNPENLLLLK